MKWRSKIIVMAVISSFAFKAINNPCIEIKNRQHLPEEIYGYLKNYRAILIGEIHGTNEAPQYTEGLVNLWLDNGQKVLLGLEIGTENQAKIDSFLLTGDSSLFHRMPFFNRSSQDGRSSIAMTRLIKSCFGKHNLKLVCIDDWQKARNRDSLMATNAVSAYKEDTGWELITLTGNIHNKLDSGKYGHTMGYYLHSFQNTNRKRSEIASIDIVFDSGTAWNWDSNGKGIHNIGGHHNVTNKQCDFENFFSIEDGESRRIFLFTKAISASVPFQ